MGLAYAMTKNAWMSPSTLPITRAEEADGICFLSCPASTFAEILFKAIVLHSSYQNQTEGKTCSNGADKYKIVWNLEKEFDTHWTFKQKAIYTILVALH